MKRIKLCVQGPEGIERRAWPVTQGVPFADGELERGAPVRVVGETGQIMPTQSLCLTTWRDDLRFVKWLLVDFQIDLPEGGAQDVYLEYGPRVAAAEPEQAIGVEQRDGRTRIDTGAMQVEFRPEDPDFLAACRVRTPKGWRDFLRGRPGPYLYMTDQRGESYDSFTAAPNPTITVEDAGPIRASVCVNGWHASQDGRRFCPYVLRVHLYAGKADMRFYHTFIFDQDPERIELRDVGMMFPIDLGDDLRMAFGGEERPHWAKRFESARLLQASDIEYRVERDGQPFGSGKQTSGWASLGGDEGSALVVVRDLWKEYPKGIALDRDGIHVEIWPSAQGETLKFATPYKEAAVQFGGTRDEAEFERLVAESPTAPLNLKSLAAGTLDDLLWVEEMVAKHAPDRPASYNDTWTNNGFGAAKTTEFLLSLSAQRISDKSAEHLALCAQEPVIAPAETSCACATGAMRMVAPFDSERFVEAEEGLDSLFERIVLEPRAKLRTYGMIDYGDLMCSHSGSPAKMWLYFKDALDIIEKMKHCARSYNNEANDQLNALWGFFVHTGERKYFLAAEAYGEHMADVDIIHANPDGSNGGLIHYHNAHHWTGGPAPSHTTTAGLMLQYYITGNRRILDVCREVADWALDHQEPCGVFSNRYGALVREYTTPVANLLEFYQATWEHRYGELARRSLKWLLLALPEPGCFPVSIYTAGDRGDEAEVEQEGWHLRQSGGMTPQLLYDAVRVFGRSDPIFREHLLGLASRYLWGPELPLYEKLVVGAQQVNRMDPYFNAPLIAYAYELTEDPAYAAFCRYYLREHFPRQAGEMSFTYVCWGSIIPPLIEAVRRAEAKFGSEELERIEEDWIEKVSQMAERPGPESPVPKPGGRPPRRAIGLVKGYDA